MLCSLSSTGYHVCTQERICCREASARGQIHTRQSLSARALAAVGAAPGAARTAAVTPASDRVDRPAAAGAGQTTAPGDAVTAAVTSASDRVVSVGGLGALSASIAALPPPSALQLVLHKPAPTLRPPPPLPRPLKPLPSPPPPTPPPTIGLSVQEACGLPCGVVGRLPMLVPDPAPAPTRLMVERMPDCSFMNLAPLKLSVCERRAAEAVRAQHV